MNETLLFDLFHPLILVWMFLILSTLVHMIYVRRSPTSIISWMFSILLFPYIAVPLYFILGARKVVTDKQSIIFKDENHYPRNDNISDILKANGLPSYSTKNDIQLYLNPQEAYRALIKQIKSAQHRICICTYVFGNDITTKAIINELIKKKKEGVEVYLLIDSIGSYKLYFFQHSLKKLKQVGVNIKFYMPILSMPFRNYINLRNHRKIYLFDDSRVLSGGMNISDEYMGEDENPMRWNDLLFLLKGESVQYYKDIFQSDWKYTSQESFQELKNKNDEEYTINALQVVPSGPDIQFDALYEALLNGIYSAKKRVWIVTPYFIPDDLISTALIIAKNKGLDIKIITPLQSNHIIADLGRSSYMRDLQERGIAIVLFKGNMLHAKSILFDDKAVMLGSVNLDNRSLLLNYEVVSFVYSEKIILEMKTWMQGLIKDSKIGMNKTTKIRRMAENLMRIFAPLL